MKSKGMRVWSVVLVLAVAVSAISLGATLAGVVPAKVALAGYAQAGSMPPGSVQGGAFQRGASQAGVSPAGPEELIRFHVVANSDSDQDQELKRAVRDAILEEVGPRLAESHSLEKSRELLKTILPEMENTAQAVVQSRGLAYPVKAVYGKAAFPTKSYGSLILPAGEYEAVRILIGEAVGANWWCVLFPPLCFVDIDQATAVAVDGKPSVPVQHSNAKKPKVRFWIWEKLSQLFHWSSVPG